MNLEYEEASEVNQTQDRASSEEISIEDQPLLLEKPKSTESKGKNPSITNSVEPRQNSNSSDQGI